MTLEMMGNIGEFIGGLAVVVSLLYLAIQIRQNSKTVRVAAYQSLSDANIRVLLAMAEGPPAAETFTKGLPDPRSLSPAEFFQFPDAGQLYVHGLSDDVLSVPRGVGLRRALAQTSWSDEMVAYPSWRAVHAAIPGSIL